MGLADRDYMRDKPTERKPSASHVGYRGRGRANSGAATAVVVSLVLALVLWALDLTPSLAQIPTG